jgi:hypothetical protein
MTVSVYRAATNNNLDNAMYILNSGKVLTLVESLVRHLTVSDHFIQVVTSQNNRLNFVFRVYELMI